MTSMRERAGQCLAMRRALGHRLECQGQLLPDFAGQMDRAGQSRLTTKDALEWACSTSAGPVTWRQRLSVIRCFARQLAALDPSCEVPPPGLLKATARRPAPYLYSPREIAVLITAADTLSPPMRLMAHGLIPADHRAATISDRITVPGAPAASGGASATWTRPQAHSAACRSYWTVCARASGRSVT
jgi:hypothetical protein